MIEQVLVAIGCMLGGAFVYWLVNRAGLLDREIEDSVYFVVEWVDEKRKREGEE